LIKLLSSRSLITPLKERQDIRENKKAQDF
jgi:hypothetical protein